VPVAPVEPVLGVVVVPVLVFGFTVLGDEVLVELDVELVVLLGVVDVVEDVLLGETGIVFFESGRAGEAPVSGPVVPVFCATATPATTTRLAAAAVVRRVTSLFIPGTP
jgi:hypothetical protein